MREGGLSNPEATYDIHILDGVCPGGGKGGSGWRRTKTEGDGERCREGASVAEVGCWWWLPERRRQWCRPVARWRQPWYSNPVAKGIGAAAGAGAGNAAGAGAHSTSEEW